MSAPVVSINECDLKIDWVAPNSNGAPIERYNIMMQVPNTNQFVSLTMCGQNGANSGTTCRVSMNLLVSDYFYQAYDEIVLIAQAENEIGLGPLSDSSIVGLQII
jgi:hypothetical protein